MVLGEALTSGDMNPHMLLVQTLRIYLYSIKFFTIPFSMPSHWQSCFMCSRTAKYTIGTVIYAVIDVKNGTFNVPQ